MLATLNQTAYAQLLADAQPTLIDHEEDYDRIISLVDGLLFKATRSPEEDALLELLKVLIRLYDDQHYPMADCSGREVLLELMADNDLKQVDLVGILGSKGIVSEVINGKREISKKQAYALGEFFGLPYRVFL